jgi:hypothetical protein
VEAVEKWEENLEKMQTRYQKTVKMLTVSFVFSAGGKS